MNACPKAVASMAAGGTPVFSRPRDRSAVCGKFAEDTVLSMEKVADGTCTLPGGAAYSYSMYSTFAEPAFTGTGASTARKPGNSSFRTEVLRDPVDGRKPIWYYSS